MASEQQNGSKQDTQGILDYLAQFQVAETQNKGKVLSNKMLSLTEIELEDAQEEEAFCFE